MLIHFPLMVTPDGFLSFLIRSLLAMCMIGDSFPPSSSILSGKILVQYQF